GRGRPVGRLGRFGAGGEVCAGNNQEGQPPGRPPAGGRPPPASGLVAAVGSSSFWHADAGAGPQAVAPRGGVERAGGTCSLSRPSANTWPKEQRCRGRRPELPKGDGAPSPVGTPLVTTRAQVEEEVSEALFKSCCRRSSCGVPARRDAPQAASG